MRKTEVRTTPVRSQQCECQQCEGVNSANETRVRMSNVRMPAVRCDIGTKKVRQQCECQQCESHFFLFTDSDWIWTERKKGASENLNAQARVTCCPTRTDLFSAHLHLQHLGFNVCVYVNLCANSRGEKGMGRLWYMVLFCNTAGLEKRTRRRKPVSAIPDFRAVVGIPRSTYSAITTKSKMSTPRMKKSF